MDERDGVAVSLKKGDALVGTVPLLKVLNPVVRPHCLEKFLWHGRLFIWFY
jgi:hypothetical protein